MTAVTEVCKPDESPEFLQRAVGVVSTRAMEELLAELPIVSVDDKSFDPVHPANCWKAGMLHWVPVGKDRGNAGRIKLANQPVNPMAERIVNGMEALIELARQREILRVKDAPAPRSPRDASMRYFELPSLDRIPLIKDAAEHKRVYAAAREMARKLRVRLIPHKHKGSTQFAVIVEDDGIGQSPDLIHERLLSLGASDKGDKPYLIGLFGQGGSSAFSVSEYSWVISRRAPDLLDGGDPGVGWSVVKQVFQKGRRDPYFAYLAAHPDGRVPVLTAAAGDAVGLAHGTRFGHIGYDFNRSSGAVARMLFPALNHILYNPILPYELYTARDTGDIMWGHANRLSNLQRKPKEQRPLLDKTFAGQTVFKDARTQS